jgi:hypothetical protein
MNNTKFIIEEYIDSNSKNLCEIFSVIINGENVYERDYGSQTEHITDYIKEYEDFMGLVSYNVIIDGEKKFTITI